MIKFKFNRRYTYTVPFGTISATGMSLIANLLLNAPHHAEFAALNPSFTATYLYGFPVDFDPRVVAVTGQLRGKFARRVSQYFWRTHQIRLPDAILTQIGNLASMHSAGDTRFVFDFVRRFNWEAGDFGDQHSCYWGAPRRRPLYPTRKWRVRRPVFQRR